VAKAIKTEKSEKLPTGQVSDIGAVPVNPITPLITMARSANVYALSDIRSTKPPQGAETEHGRGEAESPDKVIETQ
jgi:hypothetical protein